MKIKNYLEYISEMYKQVDISSSGKTKYINWIHDEPSSSKSASSGILLKKELGEKEFDDLKASLEDPLILNHKGSDRFEKIRITLNNLKFLKDKAKDNDLYCEYCNKGPLVIYDINPVDSKKIIDNPRIRLNSKFNVKDGATCDHKEPTSRGGSKFDYKNLAVCCSSCNKRKGNMSWENWLKIIPTLK